MSNPLYTAVTGLRIHQEMLNVVGNNLANSNTTAFKAQRTLFSDLVYQTLSAATSSGSTIGGTNPVQIGLGAAVASVSANLSQGSLEATGQDLDLAINGSGFFAARGGTETFYTRAGAFGIDAQSCLVDPSTGYRIQRLGTTGEGTATGPAFQIPGNSDISIPNGTVIPGNITSQIILQGNVSASASGPLAQTLTSIQPFTIGGAAATTATLLNSLDDNPIDYAAGDQLRLQGVDAANSPVNVLIPVDGTTTIANLISAINANFPGSLAALDATGNLVIQANANGPTSLSLAVTDVAGNTGGSNWINHNLAATTIGKDGDIVQSGIQIYDLQGLAHNLDLVLQKQSNNLWNMTVKINPGEGVVVDGLVDNINFNEDGSFRQVTGTGLGDGTITLQFNGFASTQTIGFAFGSPNGYDGLTQLGVPSSSTLASAQDGFSAGALAALSINQDGVINGTFTNGRILPIAQLAITLFANPAALNRVGSNYYSLSSESGPALPGAGLVGGRGSIQQEAIESSNVDVALEFTRLIIAQRGFQVNARIITATDQILQDLANILR